MYFNSSTVTTSFMLVPTSKLFFLLDFCISKSRMITWTLYNLQNTFDVLLPYTLSSQDNVQHMETT